MRDSDEPAAVHPLGFAGGAVGRKVDTVALSVVMLVGFWLLVAGLEVVASSKLWGFTYDGAANGILSQLAVTGPAALLMALATSANILAGAVVLRLLGTPAFRSLTELILGGFAAAVALDAVALFLLGSVGFFGWPELLALHLVAAWVYIAMRRRRPLMAVPLRLRTSRPAAWWLLVVAVWAGPLIVQLASPAVPFMDVLPNHVAPVEHIRVFGSFSTLTTSPSPIYGASRLMLGYVALLGQLTTIVNLDAVLAEAAFALPLTILVALAFRRLAGELFGGSASFWVLLTFPLTFTFMRLSDSRGTVVVFPLAVWAFCTIAAEVRANHNSAARSRGRDVIGLTLALGGAVLVHPLIGLVAIAAAGLALIMYPAALVRRLVPALVGAAVLAVPQALTMADISAPAWVGAVFIVVGVAVAFGLAVVVGWTADLVSARFTARRARWMGGRRAADAGRVAFIVSAIILLLVWASLIVPPSTDPTNPSDPLAELMLGFPLLVWLAIAGAAVSILRFRRGWILLGCGIVGGLVGWTASGLVGSANLTERAVHYEVPKTIEYWLPAMLAIGAAGAIAAVWRMRRLGLMRPAAIAVFLVVSVYPTTQPLVTNVDIGEHRAAESVGLALREAELGYWTLNGYPDTRLIIDAPRREVVDKLRSEETAGRLGPSTRVLTIAWWFQQWVAVPVGVFTGAMETSISLRPELSIHTVGGRLFGFDRLDQELASGYGYVVLQPGGLSSDLVTQTKAMLEADGYRQIWSNSIATVYAGH